MGRLIDADKLEKDIRQYADKKCCHGELELANGILKSLSVIKKQPTAYDVDGVVERLAKRFDYCHEMAEKNDKAKLEKMAFSWRQVANGVMDAFYIVKGVVKDE